MLNPSIHPSGSTKIEPHWNSDTQIPIRTSMGRQNPQKGYTPRPAQKGTPQILSCQGTKSEEEQW